MPASPAAPGLCASTSKPTSSANAGSRLIRVPNAEAFSLRSASSSRVNGTTGRRMANPMPMSRISGVIRGITEAPTTAVEKTAPTPIDTASPLTPSTPSPTRWVSRM